MIVGGDRAIEMPVKDLYNTQLMLASINAAKDIYDYGQKRMDDFQKTYGDFYSPIAKDVDYWYNNTIKKVGDVIDYLYRNGIDPTRSAEGRAIIQRTIRESPVGELAKIKQSSEAGKTYQKNAAILKAAGKFSQQFETFRMNGKNLSNWDTAKDGVWTEVSPMEYQTLHDFALPSVQNTQERALADSEAQKLFGSSYNPNHMYTGVMRDDVKTAFSNQIAGMAGNDLLEYYKYLTRQRLQQEPGFNALSPSEQENAINDRLADEAVDSTIKEWNKKHDLGMTKEAELKLNDYYDAQKQARGYQYDIKKADHQQDLDIAKLKFQYKNDPTYQKYTDYGFSSPEAALLSAAKSGGKSGVNNVTKMLSSMLGQGMTADSWLRLQQSLNDIGSYQDAKDKAIIDIWNGKAGIKQALERLTPWQNQVYNKFNWLLTNKGSKQAVDYLNKTKDVKDKWQSIGALRQAIYGRLKQHEIRNEVSNNSYTDAYTVFKTNYSNNVTSHSNPKNSVDTIKDAHNKFFKQNVVSTDASSKAILSSYMGSVWSKKSNGYQGSVDNKTNLATISERKATSNLTWAGRSVFGMLQKAINGKQFTITPSAFNGALYGAMKGDRKGSTNAFVRFDATFSLDKYPELKDAVNMLSDGQRDAMGIKFDSTKGKTVTIPLIKEVPFGSSSVQNDHDSDKSIGGASYAKDQALIRDFMTAGAMDEGL